MIQTQFVTTLAFASSVGCFISQSALQRLLKSLIKEIESHGEEIADELMHIFVEGQEGAQSVRGVGSQAIGDVGEEMGFLCYDWPEELRFPVTIRYFDHIIFLYSVNQYNFPS